MERSVKSRLLKQGSCALLTLGFLVLGAQGSLYAQDLQGGTIRRSEARLELVEFRELPLRDALRVLAEQTDLNFAASAKAGQVKVSLFLKNVTAKGALEALCKVHNLWYRMEPKSEYIRIHTAEEYQRDIRSFREDQVETFTLLYPNAVDVANALRSLFGDRIRFQNTQSQRSQAQIELQQRFQRFDLIDGRSQGFGNANNNARNNQNFNQLGQQNNLGGFSNFNQNFPRANSPERLQANRNRITGLTGEQIQRLNQAEALGQQSPKEVQSLIDQTTIYLSVVESLNQLIVRASDDRAMKQIRAIIKRLDKATPMVLLEVKVLSIDLSDGFNSTFDFQGADGSTSSGGFTTGDILPPASDAVSGTARRGLSLSPQGSGLRPDNLIFQHVHEHFRARVQLFENKNRVTQLATPLLLTANNEVSRLFIGDNRPILQNFSQGQNFVVNGVVTSSPPIPQFANVDVGTSLLITPKINADKTVTLRLVQENSQVVPGGASILVPQGTGFVSQQVDIVQSRTLSGTVVAKDGLALAVGGLIEEGVSDQRAGVPWLGRIPLLGFVFRRETRGQFRRELVVIIRPYILNSPELGEKKSGDLLTELSLHPIAAEMAGTLKSYGPGDVIRPAEAAEGLRKVFRFHAIELEND